ncbi:hypothetical protein Tco_0876084 [Tanacetum coccineum]|uniref:Uncharacterized protein n=1 Tax=Tanacetum coccineum TaxID=301880 RepID=A0ABQ5BST5_9ASTR
MTEMFGLLKELTTNRAPKKVLIREEAKFPVTKNINSISITRWEEERSKKTDVTTDDNIVKSTKTETEMLVKEAEKEDEVENEPNRKAGKEETTGAPSSQPVEYYLKHRINEKLIEGLVDNHSYMKLTDERPAETDTRLSLAGHSCIYPLEIAEDILVEVAEHFDQWKSKNFKGKHLALVIVEGGMDDEGEVTKFLVKNEEEFLTVPRNGVGIKPDSVASPTM